MDELTYAKVDGPPDDWFDIVIIDEDSGQEVARVVEVNAAEGWLIRHAVDSNGQLFLVGEGEEAEIAKERITGRFKLSRRPRS